MKNLAKAFLSACALMLLVQPAFAQGTEASRGLRQGQAGQGLGANVDFEAPVSRPFLQGTWAGVMTAVGLDGDPVPGVFPPFPNDPGRQLGFQLAIDQTNLVIYLQNGENWIPIGEGQDLRLNDRGRSAMVVTALPAAGGAIEVWMLNIIRWEEDTLLVHLTRTTGANEAAQQGPGVLNLMGILDRV